jgi:sec-independent protein translocase protein TatC
VAPSQTFSDHVTELRKRLLYIALAVFIFSSLGYMYRDPIIDFLQRPLGAPLFFNSPAGSFNFVIQISMMIGFMVAIPVIIYQLARFIEPALPKRLTRWAILEVMLASSTLALMGAAFGYFILIPSSLEFFLGFSSEQIKPLISTNEYLRYVINILVAFAIIFQIPLIVLFINRIKPLQPKKLLKYQRHIIVGSLGLALVLPFTYDPFTMFMIALPMVFLYYFSIILVWARNRSRKTEVSIPKATLTVDPEPMPAAPAVNNNPLPVPVMPALKPRMLSMDGFMAQPRPAVAAVHKTSIQKPVNRQTSLKNQTKSTGLSIDGIRQPLTGTL